MSNDSDVNYLVNSNDRNITNYSDFSNATNTSVAGTCCDIGEENIIVPVIFSVVILFGCVGNAVVIAFIVRTRRRVRNTTNVFMVNLSVADLMFLMFCIPFHAVIYTVPNWPFGTAMCKSVHFLQYASMLASVFTLVAMAFDRYCSVSYRVHHKLSVRIAIAGVTCFLIWFVSVGVASPWLVFYTVKTYPYTPEPLDICADDWATRRKDRPIYFLCLFLFGYAIPFLIIFILSILTVKNLTGKIPLSTNPRYAMKNKRRATRFVISLVCVFGLCWLPYHVTWLWANFLRGTFLNNYVFYYMRVFSLILSYANSMMNPYIYAFFSIPFRRTLRCPFTANMCTRAHNRHSRTIENDSALNKYRESIRLHHVNGVVSSSLRKISEINEEADFESLQLVDLTIMRVQSCPSNMFITGESGGRSSKRSACLGMSV